MKTKLTSVGVALILAFVWVGGSFAKETKKNADEYPALLAASEIKGTKVKNLQSQEIGDIDEVLIEPETGHVRFAVLNVGGFLGIGATKVAVPWIAFQITKEGNKPKYVLDATKERLEKAPKVAGRRYERLYTREEAEPVYVYWNITWVEPAPAEGPSTSASPGPSISTSP